MHWIVARSWTKVLIRQQPQGMGPWGCSGVCRLLVAWLHTQPISLMG
jgi:hypothetical protein